MLFISCEKLLRFSRYIILKPRKAVDVQRSDSAATEDKLSEKLSENSSSDEELNSSRHENLHWCKCSCCVIYNTFKLVECKCCSEFSTLLNDIKCITMNNEFEILCLNQFVLETASIGYRRYHKNFKELSNYSNK